MDSGRVVNAKRRREEETVQLQNKIFNHTWWEKPFDEHWWKENEASSGKTRRKQFENEENDRSIKNQTVIVWVKRKGGKTLRKKGDESFLLKEEVEEEEEWRKGE